MADVKPRTRVPVCLVLVVLLGLAVAAGCSTDRGDASAAPPMGVRTVRRVTLHRDVPAAADPTVAADLRDGRLHAVAFASSTAARRTAELYGPLPPGLLVVAMGRRTVLACEETGIRVDAVADEPGIAGLVTAVCRLAAPPA